MSQVKVSAKIASLREEDVCDWLSERPDFFQRHPDVLREIDLPHESGEAISLVEHQVRLLRHENRTLHCAVQTMKENAELNERSLQRVRTLIRRLLGVNDLKGLFTRLYGGLQDDFSISEATIRVWPRMEEKRRALTEFDENLLLRALFDERTSGTDKESGIYCGSLSLSQAHLLFADRSSGLLSFALIPLGVEEEWQGMLCMGSDAEDRFAKESGTRLLEQLGAVLTAILHPWVTRR